MNKKITDYWLVTSSLPDNYDKEEYDRYNESILLLLQKGWEILGNINIQLDKNGELLISQIFVKYESLDEHGFDTYGLGGIKSPTFNAQNPDIRRCIKCGYTQE